MESVGAVVIDKESSVVHERGKYWIASDFSTVKKLFNHKHMHVATFSNLDKDDHLRLSNHTYATTYDFFKHFMLARNPHEGHTQIRSLFMKFMSLSKMMELIPEITEASQRLLQNLTESRKGDLAQEYAYILPAMITAKLLGLPDEMMDKVKVWSILFLDAAGSMSKEDRYQRSTPAVLECRAMFFDLLRKKRIEILSPRSTSSSDGKKRYLIDYVIEEIEKNKLAITDEELVANFGLLMFASQDTLQNTISQALACVLYDRNIRDEIEQYLFDDKLSFQKKSLIIEEFVRAVGPVDFMARRAAADIPLLRESERSEDPPIPVGIIKEGELVLLDVYSSCHDGRVFSAPDEVKVSRFLTNIDKQQHIGFGAGRHVCLGRHLARVEVTVALTEFLRAFPRDSLDLLIKDRRLLPLTHSIPITGNRNRIRMVHSIPFKLHHPSHSKL